jgi:hypothetical protein
MLVIQAERVQMAQAGLRVMQAQVLLQVVLAAQHHSHGLVE